MVQLGLEHASSAINRDNLLGTRRESAIGALCRVPVFTRNMVLGEYAGVDWVAGRSGGGIERRESCGVKTGQALTYYPYYPSEACFL